MKRLSTDAPGVEEMIESVRASVSIAIFRRVSISDMAALVLYERQVRCIREQAAKCARWWLRARASCFRPRRATGSRLAGRGLCNYFALPVRLLDVVSYFSLPQTIVMTMRNSLLFPRSAHVHSLDAWSDRLRAPDTYEDAARCAIESITHYKASSDMEHEYLVVHARHSSGSAVVLSVDRNAEEDMGQATSSRYALNAILSYPSSGSDTAAKDQNAGISAFDGVEVSVDGTPQPIIARHGPSIELNTLVLSSSIDDESTPGVNLHQLTVLLFVIRSHFPSYILLQHQCYFFARATVLSMSSIFKGKETPHPENYALQGTWRGAHVSLFAAGKTALQNMAILPLLEFPMLLVPAGIFALYTTLSLYDGHSVKGPRDRMDIRPVWVFNTMCLR